MKKAIEKDIPKPYVVRQIEAWLSGKGVETKWLKKKGGGYEEIKVVSNKSTKQKGS